MAGIKGQPTPKPSDVKSPVPAPAPTFEEFLAQDSAPTFEEFEAGAVPVTEAPPVNDFPGRGAVEFGAEYLPAAGGLIGGLAGGLTAGPAGAVAGAALGGAAGQSYRQLIETQLLGKRQPTPGQAAQEIGTQGALEGAAQVIGGAITKVGGKALSALAKSPLGQRAAAIAEKVVEEPLAAFKRSFSAAQSDIEERLTKLISEKSTALTSEAAGDAAKVLLKQNIQSKYGPFIQAYADLDNVAKTIPVNDEVRRRFTMGLKEWGVENHAGDNWKVIRKFADDIDAASSARQIDDVIGQISDAKSLAYRNNASKQYVMLKELQEKATDFMEGETTKLAARIRAGKATPQEMGFVQQLMQQRGIQEADPSKYAKSLAKDYLAAKEKIKTDYGAFRSFLEDVGEQTKVKASKKGPMTFLDNIDDVPSEKLVERMFDPKNAAALRRMRSETPEVFDTVVRAKMGQLVQKSSPSGTLDLNAFRKAIYGMPDSTRNLLMSADDMRVMNQVIDDPRLARLQRLQEKGESNMLKWAEDLVELTRFGVKQSASAGGKALNSPVGRQAVGKGAMGLAEAFGPLRDPEQ